MRDIWNPWHGCVKCSEGCRNCYMYFLDRVRDRNGADIYRTKSGDRLNRLFVAEKIMTDQDRVTLNG